MTAMIERASRAHLLAERRQTDQARRRAARSDWACLLCMIALGIMMVMQARLGDVLATRGLALFFGLSLLFCLAARRARAGLARDRAFRPR